MPNRTRVNHHLAQQRQPSPGTGQATHPTCYLEDLYVAKPWRGGGIARRLIEAVYAFADGFGPASVYWLTQEYNAPARSLYDTLARRTSFVVYQR